MIGFLSFLNQLGRCLKLRAYQSMLFKVPCKWPILGLQAVPHTTSFYTSRNSDLLAEAPCLALFCKHLGPGFLISRVHMPWQLEPLSSKEASFVPAAANCGTKSISCQRVLSWQQLQLLALQWLCDVTRYLHSRGKSLFVALALISLQKRVLTHLESPMKCCRKEARGAEFRLGGSSPGWWSNVTCLFTFQEELDHRLACLQGTRRQNIFPVPSRQRLSNAA